MNSVLHQTIYAPAANVFGALQKVIADMIVRGEGSLPASNDASAWIGTTFNIPFPGRRSMMKYNGEITQFDPPNRFSFSAQCNSARYSDIEIAFHATEVIDNNEVKTNLTCNYEWSTQGLFQRLESKLAGPPFARGLSRLMRRLKSILEIGSIHSGGERKLQLWGIDSEEYKGLPVFCAPGTHAAALEILAKHIQPDGEVLDLAAGTGAWLTRLQDFGFQQLDAVELSVDKFYCRNIKARPLDLNTGFSEVFDSSFRLVTALEIIEHLDSPRHFLQQIYQLLSAGGYLLLTTPNIGSWRGRLKFLLQAEHRHFGEFDYHSQRHISPVSDLQMRLMFKELGFQLIDSTTAGDYSGPLKRLLWLPLSLPFRILLGPRTKGECNIYLVTKVKSDT